MPASPDEVEAALEEGAKLEELTSPVRIVREGGRVAALELVRNRLGGPGSDGRRKPAPIPGSEFRAEVDSVIFATGQRADLSFLAGSAVRVEGGAIVADEGGRTSVSRVYAGGDVAPGVKSVIAAAAHGLRAAEAICADLGIPFSLPPIPRPELLREELAAVKHARTRKGFSRLPRNALGRGFAAVVPEISPEVAREEALRCLQCSLVCDKCVEVCPNRANLVYYVEPVCWKVPVVSVRDDTLKVVRREPFRVEQMRQIVHLDDFCNECGNCATFCVHRGDPAKEKPRLFLRLPDIYDEEGNAFHVTGDTIYRKEGDLLYTLERTHEGYLLSITRHASRVIVIRISPDFSAVELEEAGEFQGELNLRAAAEMAVILMGARESLSHLPVRSDLQ